MNKEQRNMEQGIRIRTVILIWVLLSGVSSMYAQPCLPEGITFSTQSQVDSFPINYPNCTEIEGDVIFPYPNTVSSLQGLSAISAIGGHLEIVDCNELTSLEGLNSIQSIGGALSIVSNDNLLNLYALQNLRTIGGGLTISWNYRLKSLSGIDSISAESIDALHMIYNDSLSWCAVESVCQYIVSPDASVTLHNAVGCDSVEVVEELCSHIGIPEQRSDPQLSVYPNPFITSTTIEYELKEPSRVQLSIYNSIGEQVYKAEDRMVAVGKHTFNWKADQFPEGMYYAVLRSEDGVSDVKIVKK
jgi:hypothetical protein